MVSFTTLDGLAKAVGFELDGLPTAPSELEKALKEVQASESILPLKKMVLALHQLKSAPWPSERAFGMLLDRCLKAVSHASAVLAGVECGEDLSAATQMLSMGLSLFCHCTNTAWTTSVGPVSHSPPVLSS
jgi:hypothetical protein